MDGIVAAPAAEGAGEGSSPLLDLAGFNGRLERLLVLARAHQIDLARISLPALVDQLIAALRDASGRTPLGLQAEWVVMTAWLVQLRSRLLLPANATGQDAAGKEAVRLRHDLVRLGETQAAARWLDARPQLGRDVFPRGQPEWIGTGTATLHQVDVIEFLWALFDDDLPGPDTAASYRPLWLDLHALPDARDRILRLLGDSPDGRPLDQLLPEQAGDAGDRTGTTLKRRSAWTSTFVASLELAKQGKASLQQEQGFAPIRVRQGPGAASPADPWT